MSIDLSDEDLLRRFLLGDVAAAEREQIEEAFLLDSGLHQQLRAIEDELIIDYLRGRLPVELRSRLKQQIEQSTERQRRVAEVQQLLDAATPAAPAVVSTVPQRSWWRPAMLAAAAVLLVVTGRSFWPSPTAPAVPDTRVAVAEPPSDIVFDVRPVVRNAPGNEYSVPQGRTSFILRFPLAATAAEQPAFALAVIGGQAIDVGTTPAIEYRSGELALVRWTVPVAAIKPGDYELVVTTTGPGGPVEKWRSSFTLIPP